MKVFFIDTFTSKRFSGNPAAVCLVDKPLTDDVLLSLAKEFNLPVTAFIEKKGSFPNLFDIRYFTVTNEIPACGHATLACASVVMELFSVAEAAFQTIENIKISVKLREDIIAMEYPKYTMAPFRVSKALLQSLQIEKYRSSGFCKELETLFIELDNPAHLKDIQPDYKKLVEANDEIIEVVITSVSDDQEYDFFLRSFCPWIGINEDPVTGSVHSVLAGFWQQKTGKDKMKAYQASKRGGEIYITAVKDKVQIGGKTIRVLEGDIFI